MRKIEKVRGLKSWNPLGQDRVIKDRHIFLFNDALIWCSRPAFNVKCAWRLSVQSQSSLIHAALTCSLVQAASP